MKMGKIKLFILTLLLGFAYVWVIMLCSNFLLQFFARLNIQIPDELIFGLPIMVDILTVLYFMWKKKGCTPIVGVILGFIFGYLWLFLGLILGNA